MIRIRVWFIVAILFVNLGWFESARAQSTNNQLSFIQVANTGTLVAIPGQSNQYTLTLFNISPYITYYLKRPSRLTGLATFQNFINAWKVGQDSFAANNPNAVIYAGQINGQPNQAETTYVVQLGDPVYNQQKNQVSYTVTPLGAQGFILNNINLGYVSLMIN